MSLFRTWLNRHKFQAYLLAFVLMVLPPVPLYLAARQEAFAWIWLLIGLVVVGNVLAIVVP